MKFVQYIAISALLFSSCGEEPEQEPEVEWTKEHSYQYGHQIAKDEQMDIRIFLEMRPEWDMETTGSGLQYWVYEARDDGEAPVIGDIVEFELKVTLLDGTECYGTGEDEYQETRIDQSEAESGIQEGLKRMKVGEKAKLIIPSHLGHGLLGDFDKIPQLHTLVVDLYLTGIKGK